MRVFGSCDFRSDISLAITPRITMECWMNFQIRLQSRPERHSKERSAASGAKFIYINYITRVECITLLKLIHYFSLLLRCLAHVINLATQALIKAHTKSKHYNPASPDEHMPDTQGFNRDEVGLIRAISVKVCGNALTKWMTYWCRLYRSGPLPSVNNCSRISKLEKVLITPFNYCWTCLFDGRQHL
jgi:hypothetical protein